MDSQQLAFASKVAGLHGYGAHGIQRQEPEPRLIKPKTFERPCLVIVFRGRVRRFPLCEACSAHVQGDHTLRLSVADRTRQARHLSGLLHRRRVESKRQRDTTHQLSAPVPFFRTVCVQSDPGVQGFAGGVHDSGHGQARLAYACQLLLARKLVALHEQEPERGHASRGPRRVFLRIDSQPGACLRVFIQYALADQVRKVRS